MRLKKKIAAALAATFALGVTTAFAANPFVDVPANHWAYDAVAKLAAAGIIEGYGDGTFRGGQEITRYEMAQMVAKAMAHVDKADAEQRAMINKLAAEFGSELDNLGVRVTKLEQNQPKVLFNGTADMRWTSNDYKMDGDHGRNGTNYQYRLRLGATGNIDEETTAGLRLTTAQSRNLNKLDAYNASQPAEGRLPRMAARYSTFSNANNGNNNNQIELDRLWVKRAFGSVDTTLGLQALKLGGGNIIDAGAYTMAGVRLETKTDSVNIAANYGKFETDGEVASLDLSGNVTDKLSLGAYYSQFKDTVASNDNKIKYVGGYGKYMFADKLSLAGEYAEMRPDGGDKAKVGIATLLVGDQTLAQKGNNNVMVRYYKSGDGALLWTGLDVARVDDFSALSRATEGWNVQYNYAFAKNASGYLAWTKVKDRHANDVMDFGYNFYRVGVSANF